MAIEVPDYYIEQKFFEKVGYPKKFSNGNMVGGCPFCMEGSSWGRKSRFNYYNETKYFSCYNCGINLSAINFLKEVDGKSFREVMVDLGKDSLSDNIYNFTGSSVFYKEEPKEDLLLPSDCVNLFDPQQTNFYKGDFYIKLALNTIKGRKLNLAPYRTDLFISREDFIHKNRLIIPFYDSQGKLSFYQSRSQTSNQLKMGKYLSALDGRKTFFGLDKLDMSKGVVFVLEGPLDCFFVANSIGGGGLKLNSSQNEVIDELRPFYDVVWCLDNDFGNVDVKKRYLELIKQKERVFLWGKEYSGIKDFNEYCLDKDVLEVPIEKILDRTFSGSGAIKEFTKLV